MGGFLHDRDHADHGGVRGSLSAVRTGQVFTVVLLLTGLGVFLLLATDVARTVVEGELRQVLGRARRSRMIERLSGHDVVCGWGRMGRAVVEELQAGEENARTGEDSSQSETASWSSSPRLISDRPSRAPLPPALEVGFGVDICFVHAAPLRSGWGARRL